MVNPSQSEDLAHMFQMIRSNSEKSPNSILKLIHKEFPKKTKLEVHMLLGVLVEVVEGSNDTT